MEAIWRNRCGWCKTGMQDNPELVISETKVPIQFERQYLEKIIFLSLRENPPHSYACISRGEEESERKEVPVFMIPAGEDSKDIVIRTCGKECAESVRIALENEEYVYEWNFEDGEEN